MFYLQANAGGFIIKYRQLKFLIITSLPDAFMRYGATASIIKR